MRKKLAIIFLIIFILILGFLSIVFINNLNKNEKDYVSELTNIGNEAYSEYYYKIMAIDKNETDLKAYLKKYETTGLKFDLEALKGYAINQEKADYYNLINEFLSKNKKCNENGTKVIVYPKEPYGATDFTSEIKFNCDVN